MTLPEIERRQARLARKRKLWTAALSAVILSCVLLCAWSAMHIMPFYGDWYRANHFDEHPAGFLSGPLLLEIEISYDGEPPGNASLVEQATDRQVYGLSEIPERCLPGVLVLAGDFDAGLRPGEYSLRLRPGDNKKLSCRINVLPSEKYIGLDVAPYRSAGNDLWLEIGASYYNASGSAGPGLAITLDGPGYSKTAYAYEPDGPEYEKHVNLSALFYDLGLDVSAGDHITIRANAERRRDDGDGNSVTDYVKAEKSLALSEWPAHDPDGNFDYSPSDTDAYLASLED